MSDVNCPYCKHEQEINHDDGYGFTEDIEYSQDCVNCGVEFKFTTSISINYRVYCANGDHDMKQSPIEKYSHIYSCSKCAHSEIRCGENK